MFPIRSLVVIFVMILGACTSGGTPAGPSGNGGGGGGRRVGGSGGGGAGGGTGGGSGGTVIDSPPAMDVAAEAAEVTPETAADGVDTSPGLVCGEGTAMLPTAGEVGGLVVLPDGTIFHTQGFMGMGLSRIRPGQPPENAFLYVGASASGITYDPRRQALFVAVFFTKAVLRIDLAASAPRPTMVARGGAGADGLTLAEDGTVYFSDRVLGEIWRVPPTGGQVQVTTTSLPGGPNGLAFGKDGKLYVSQRLGTDVLRLTLDAAGQESGRETFASLGVKDGGGLAFDEEGNLYVAAGQLFQIDPSGKKVTPLPGGGRALDFGAGALRCSDLYVGGTGIKAQAMGKKGLDVPWHRSP